MRGYHALGAVYAEMWDEARAQRAMEEAVKLEPESARWLLSLGHVLQNRGDTKGATTKYDAATKIVPDYPPALLATANLSIDTNYAEIARRKVDRAVKA